MKYISLYRQISLLKKQNIKLKLKIHQIHIQYYKKTSKQEKDQNPDQNQNCEPDQNQDKDQKQAKSLVNQIILNDINSNFNIAPNLGTFSDETKIFSYTLFVLSPNCYNTIRNVLPFPSEQILRAVFSKDISNFEKKITDVNKAGQISEERGKNISEDKILVTLSIDAFSINQLENSHNYAFIYLILPFSKKYRPFPILIHSAEKGNADLNVDDNIKKNLDFSKGSKFKIKCISVDGDKHYNALFLEKLNILNSKFSLFQNHELNFDLFIFFLENDEYFFLQIFYTF